MSGAAFSYGTCGRQFKNLVHLRSHQSRICSTTVIRWEPAGTTVRNVDHHEDGNVDNHDDGNDYDGISTMPLDTGKGEVEEDIDGNIDEESDTMPDVDNADEDLEEIDPSNFQLTDSVLVQLDAQKQIADDIYYFYDSVTQLSEPVIKEHVDFPESVQRMP